MGRWIRRTERVLGVDVPGPPDEVRAFYTDLNNICLVHPLVVAVRTLDRRQTGDCHVQTYRVVDRIPFGPLRLRTSYVARLVVPAEGEVSSQARQFPGVRLDGTVAFEPIQAGTRLVERLVIAAPWPLASMTVRTALAAHAEMLAAIRRRFGN
jgi:hypothetical protein